MTGFILVRHAAHDLISTTITGRMPGVHLSETGRAAAERLAEQLGALPVDHILSSPLDRARETAEPLSRRLGLPVQIAPDFNEIDTGEWTGLTFNELAPRSDWQHWNSF